MLSKEQTYIMFKKEEGEVTFLISPCFEDEIEGNKELYFEEDESYEVLKEEVFREIYKEEYLHTKKTDWIDFADSLISSFIGFDIDLILNDDDRSIESELFVVMLSDDGDSLYIWFEYSCTPYASALLVLELSTYFSEIFDLEIKGLYYASKDGKVYTQEEIPLKNLIENINKN